ncbi:MAG TPA: hypothetical protein PKA55_16950 [Rhodoblastus sp.]|nr:hypothetical protein [Rhodoblastus sp.]
MRLFGSFVRILLVLALAFAAPAFAGAPAQAVAVESAHDHHAGRGERAHAARHDCGDPASPIPSHHGSADCALCCCALAEPLAPPQAARAANRLAHVESHDAVRSLSLPPPAPPPRA